MTYRRTIKRLSQGLESLLQGVAGGPSRDRLVADLQAQMRDSAVGNKPPYRVHNRYDVYIGEELKQRGLADVTEDDLERALEETLQETSGLAVGGRQYELPGILEVHLHHALDSSELCIYSCEQREVPTRELPRGLLKCQDAVGDTQVFPIGVRTLLQRGPAWKHTLGADGETIVHMPDEHVSADHALVTWETDHFQVENLSQTNPTLVNDKAINGRTRLEFGQLLTVGQIALLLARVYPLRALLSSLGGFLEPVHRALDEEQVCRIGRSPECEFPLPPTALTASLFHCQVEPRAGGFWLRDLASKNGTSVRRNQESLVLDGGQETRLAPGDQIVLADELVILYQEDQT